MTDTCPKPTRVEDESWYWVYLAAFIAMYFALFGLCFTVFVNEYRKKSEKVWSNNR